MPDKVDPSAGYLEGKQQAKICLVSKEDLEMMHSNQSKVILHLGVMVAKHEQNDAINQLPRERR